MQKLASLRFFYELFIFLVLCYSLLFLPIFCSIRLKTNKNKMKTKKTLSRLIASIATVFVVAAFCITSVSADSTDSGVKVVPTGFRDVPRSHQHYVSITYLTGSGVVKGYDDGSFKPEGAINRAEVLKIILGGSDIQVDPEFTADFPDVPQDVWFAPYVYKAKKLGFVKGNDSDGTFTPARQVNLAEFLKMLLAANNINTESFKDKQLADNVAKEAWFAPYINYAIASGMVAKDKEGNVEVGKNLSRSEVVNMMYILSIILKGNDTQFLLDRSEAEMAQIEVYIAANNVTLAKNASSLAVDLTQRAYKNMADNNVVLGAAKLARAYDYLVDSFILGIQNKNIESAELANKAIKKATEAWEANNATQPIAKHIKERSREILKQVGGEEEK